MDRNNTLDLVISTAAGIVVRSGTGTGAFPTATTNLGSHSFNGKPVVADLNLDGRLDVAVGDNKEAFSSTVGMTGPERPRSVPNSRFPHSIFRSKGLRPT
jgi:hypothetical protein